MNKRFILTIFTSVIILFACRKEADQPEPSPVADEPRLTIKLNSQFLSAGKIDSALVVWEKDGQKRQFALRLSNDSLFLSVKQLSEGTGRLTVQLFTAISLNQRKLQWEKRLETEVKHATPINWHAPSNLDDPEWMPRVIMVDPQSQFTAIIALRPEDPYFFLKNIPANHKIELERNYVSIPGGAHIVGGGLWKCNTVCTDENGVIENRQFFLPLPAQINGQQWRMVECGVGLFHYTQPTGTAIYFNHY